MMPPDVRRVPEVSLLKSRSISSGHNSSHLCSPPRTARPFVRHLGLHGRPHPVDQENGVIFNGQRTSIHSSNLFLVCAHKSLYLTDIDSEDVSLDQICSILCNIASFETLMLPVLDFLVQCQPSISTYRQVQTLCISVEPPCNMEMPAGTKSG